MADDLTDLGEDAIANFLSTFTWLTRYDACEVRALMSGEMLLGELSGPSDGVTFLASATHTDGLLKNGAEA